MNFLRRVVSSRKPTRRRSRNKRRMKKMIARRGRALLKFQQLHPPRR